MSNYEGSNLTSVVYEKLKDDILRGKYQKGTALAENTVAEQLSVSRTPVREALRLLEISGLVSIKPNKGAVVEGISIDDIKDIYEIRSLIEGLAAKKAAEQATEQDVERLSEIIDLTEFYFEKGHYDKLQTMDGRFHNAVYELCGGRMLNHILTDLHSYVLRFRKMSIIKEDRVRETLKEHRLIMDAIANHNGEKASELMTLHVKNALISILKIIEQENMV